VNSVGFLSKRIKTANYVGDPKQFTIRKQSGDDEVFSGTATGPVVAKDTGESLSHIDFSEFSEPGEYYIEAGEGRSAPFIIDNDVFESALHTSMLGLYGQRCGEKVEIEVGDDKFLHGACHMAEADLSRVGTGTKDDTGGWHDAGDYGKYSANGAFAVALLLSAYEQFPDFVAAQEFEMPEKGGDVPDMLDEARVELEWLLKIQFEDGSFSHKVTALDFEGVVLPTSDTQTRYFISASSTGTADSTAALAQGARLFADFDAAFAEKCLAAATAGQAWLDANPRLLQADQSGVSTGGYGDSNDTDERLWALAEIWETTGEGSYLEALEARLVDVNVDGNFDWPNVKNLGLSTYLRSKRAGRNPGLVSRVATGFLGVADSHASHALQDAYGRGMSAYYWGANGVLARLSFNLMAAYFVEPKAEYLDAIQLQLDHLFGKNYYGRSFVSGLGANPVHKPHHRPSEADGQVNPWPGLLIGGPHTRLFADPESAVAQYPAMTWTDDYPNYLHNEVAINWNTALSYALVALSAADENAPGCESCVIDGAGGAGGGGGAGGAQAN